ncbi:MAG: sigma-54-dependent Fis family transcriptional regulator [bacterium]|nr:sigma-54-dependent Fis family transcriptional regulator [bacterium]
MTAVKSTYSLLVIDDDRLFCDTVKDAFETDGTRVLTAHTKKDGLRLCAENKIDVVLLDQKLPDGEGHLLCGPILKHNDETRIIFATAYPSFDNAVRAIKEGAHDYLSKPFELEELRLAFRQSVEVVELERVRRVETYRRGRERDDSVLVGDFGDGAEIRRLIRLAASSDAPVLITGETGTGKNVVAKAVHFENIRKEKPFISTNCAALPETLIEDELFGHEKGAFTDARATRKGLFEIAAGGTLFLDEIGDMPLHLQSKLLGVLDDGRIRRLGGQSFIPVNVRVIAATNVTPGELMVRETFRRDLYYRLSVIRIHLPPLRERRRDIGVLCDFFLEKMAMGRGLSIPAGEMDRLKDYEWPGNVRELRNIIERSILVHGSTGVLRPSELLEGVVSEPVVPAVVDGVMRRLDEVEREYVERVLGAMDYNLTRSAGVLGISLSTLKRKVKLFGLKRGSN